MTDPILTPLPPRRNAIERVLGDRPGSLAIKLVLTSLVVGFLMSVFGFNAADVINAVVEFFRETFRDGAGVLRNVIGYVLAGAALVVPIWVILRVSRGR